jgi:predicted RNA binding protein YcfA (HicA-like mRNA interferase family)
VLPRISGRALAGALRKAGYDFDRQTGSHMILRHREPPFRRLTIPDHKEIAKGTLRAIIRESGLTVERLISLL